MFGLLKNKLSGFIKGLTGREEKKEDVSPAPEIQKQAPAEQPVPVEQTVQIGVSEEEKKPVKSVAEAARPPSFEEEKKPAEIPTKSIIPEPEKIRAQAPVEVPVQKPEEIPVQKKEEAQPKKSLFASVASVFSGKKPEAQAPEEKKAEEKKPAPEVKSAVQQMPVLAQEKKISPVPTAKIEHETKPAPQKIVSHPEKKPDSLQPISPSFEKKSMQEPPIEQPQPTAPSPKQTAISQMDVSRLEKRSQQEERKIAPKIGIGTAIKSFFTNEITIGEQEVADLLEELELSLLEADVAYEVSLEVSSQLKSRLVGMKVPKGEVEGRTKETVRQVLESVMDSDRKFDFINRIRSLAKPAKILFVGPNGAGKTTSMAKVARMLLNSGMTVVFSASDTFRAAAIEQTEVHAGRLGIKAIKSKYGADPASVAFDAINFARANAVDVVLIDSAGRQDTNANLLSELKKIARVCQPDLKIYVGESIGGNSIIEQIKAFHEAIGIDGAILTKMDCDAKGGTAISVAKAAGIPVLFLGMGQEYADLVPFDAGKIAREIMS